jgi:hypothetical protein
MAAISVPTAERIRANAAHETFGGPLISNTYRGLIAEIIVSEALGADWDMCSGDWRGWDFQHRDGCRLEVKQTAARQTWTASRAATKPKFDIRTRTGYFEGADWVADPRRFADIYLFAYHPIFNDTADHCDPRQWRFHVIMSNRLPPGKTISLSKIAPLSEQLAWENLGEAVEALRLLSVKVENRHEKSQTL